jgi:hypothetical protein
MASWSEYSRALDNMPLPSGHVIMPRWVPREQDNWYGALAEKAERIMWNAWKRYEDRVDFDNLKATDDLYIDYMHKRDVALSLAHATSTLIHVPN